MKTEEIELGNSKILLNVYFPSYFTWVFYFLFFILRFPSYVTRKFYFYEMHVQGF